LVSPREANRHNGALDTAETKVALLPAAVIEILSDHTQWVQKRMLGKFEPDAMLGPIAPVFRSVPFKIGHQPEPSLDMYEIPYFHMAEQGTFVLAAMAAGTLRRQTD
jgi:hypothetical protein